MQEINSLENSVHKSLEWMVHSIAFCISRELMSEKWWMWSIIFVLVMTLHCITCTYQAMTLLHNIIFWCLFWITLI